MRHKSDACKHTAASHFARLLTHTHSLCSPPLSPLSLSLPSPLLFSLRRPMVDRAHPRGGSVGIQKFQHESWMDLVRQRTGRTSVHTPFSFFFERRMLGPRVRLCSKQAAEAHKFGFLCLCLFLSVQCSSISGRANCTTMKRKQATSTALVPCATVVRSV